MENAIDTSKELRSAIVLVNEKLQFRGIVDGNSPVLIDYVPPLGDNQGYTSLELFLLSLSSCAGSAILVLLRKMQKTIKGFEISSQGIRKQEHPTGFKSINLDITVQSADITGLDMEKVLKLTDSICPVLSMIKGNVDITYTYKIRL
jgi:putative redox protein